MKIAPILAAGILCMGSNAAIAQDTGASRSQRTGGDAAEHHSGSKVTPAEFAKKAGAAGAAEVEMGKLGSQKATNADVKAYAQRMVADHTKGNKELMTAAKAKGLEVPTAPDMMHKAMMEKFERQAADKDFDHDFMQQMVRDHKMVIELYTNAANDANLDPELKSVAKKTLPVLQEHLKDAQALESKLAKK